MDLQISLFLLFALFTAGQSLSCKRCDILTGTCGQSTCSSEMTNCFSLTAYYSSTVNVTVPVGCISPTVCPSGSVNFGIFRAFSYCCDTDLCNAQDAPASNSSIPNGKSCYYCDGQDCLKTLSCSGTEDRCATGSIGSSVYKGCVSKSICDATALISDLSNFTCCAGNLCNGAQSVVHSLLFLCIPLLSFILIN